MSQAVTNSLDCLFLDLVLDRHTFWVKNTYMSNVCVYGVRSDMCVCLERGLICVCVCLWSEV